MKAFALALCTLAVFALSACADNQTEMDTAGSSAHGVQSADQVFEDKNAK